MLFLRGSGTKEYDLYRSRPPSGSVKETDLYIFHPRDDRIEFCNCVSILCKDGSYTTTLRYFDQKFDQEHPMSEDIDGIFGEKDVDIVVDPHMVKYILGEELTNYIAEGLHCDLYNVGMAVISGLVELKEVQDYESLTVLSARLRIEK